MNLRDKRDVGDIRKQLGSYADTLSDQEVERIRDLTYELGDAIFHWWLRRRNAARKLAAEAEDTHTAGTDTPSGGTSDLL